LFKLFCFHLFVSFGFDLFVCRLSFSLAQLGGTGEVNAVRLLIPHFSRREHRNALRACYARFQPQAASHAITIGRLDIQTGLDPALIY
jgi:hypothetical protein